MFSVDELCTPSVLLLLSPRQWGVVKQGLLLRCEMEDNITFRELFTKASTAKPHNNPDSDTMYHNEKCGFVLCLNSEYNVSQCQ